MNLGTFQILILLNIVFFSHLNAIEDKDSDSTRACETEKQATKTDVTTADKKIQESNDQESVKKDTHREEGKKENEKKEAEPPKIGNFSLPESQQPAGLVTLGGNIIAKGKIQLYLFADAYFGKKRILSDTIPNILFGITDELSVLFYFPFSPKMQDGKNVSKGFEDFFVQFEYAFYIKSTATYSDQATILANVTLPTGSNKKHPPTGFGSSSLFLGATYYRTWVDWIAFTCDGAILTTADHRTKFGDVFFYQWGFGRNVPSPQGWIYAWLVEFDGQYVKKNRIDGVLDKNSGGNSIFITPSLWISSETTLLQLGVNLPINQNLFGVQRKFDWGISFNFAWTYY